MRLNLLVIPLFLAVGTTAGLIAAPGLAFAWQAKDTPPPAKRPAPTERPPPDRAANLPAGAVARLGSFGYRNRAVVSALAVSRDGKLAATVSPDHPSAAKVWNLTDGVERRYFNYMYYRDAVFLPDGKTVGLAYDGVKLFDIDSGELTQHVRSQPFVAHIAERVALSLDGKLLATWSVDPEANRPPPRGKNIVCLYDLPGGKLKHRIERKHDPDVVADTSIKFLAFTADGKSIAAASWDKTLTMWDTDSGEFVREFGGPRQPAHAFAMSADGKTLAAAGDDGVVRGYELARGKEVFKLALGLKRTRALSFAPDGKHLAAAGLIQDRDRSPAGDGVWNIATGKRIAKLPTQASALSFTPDGKTLVVSDGKGKIRRFEPMSARELRPHIGHDDIVFGIAFAPDGKSLVSEAEDRTIRFWDLKTGKQTAQVEGYSISNEAPLVFSPDGRYVATRDDHNVVTLRDPHEGKVLRTLRGHRGFIFTLAFSADSKTLYSAERDGPTIVWDAGTGKSLREVSHRFIAGQSVALSLDGALLGVPCQSPGGQFKGPHQCGIWDTATGKELVKFEIDRVLPPGQFAFTPDKKTLLVSTDGPILMLDAKTGKEVRRTEGQESWAWRLAVSPDGSMFASTVGDSRYTGIRVWDTKTGKLLRELPGDGYITYALAFSPDGTLLASAGGGSSILLWDVARDRP